ncbi:hypothetical protein BC829DRAFT_236181 [Chytridium lagenaria]|nr:hypothetical protein BC829DRAFT_236181 [Chytridium lagenaria]
MDSRFGRGAEIASTLARDQWQRLSAEKHRYQEPTSLVKMQAQGQDSSMQLQSNTRLQVQGATDDCNDTTEQLKDMIARKQASLTSLQARAQSSSSNCDENLQLQRSHSIEALTAQIDAAQIKLASYNNSQNAGSFPVSIFSPYSTQNVISFLETRLNDYRFNNSNRTRWVPITRTDSVFSLKEGDILSDTNVGSVPLEYVDKVMLELEGSWSVFRRNGT